MPVARHAHGALDGTRTVEAVPVTSILIAHARRLNGQTRKELERFAGKPAAREYPLGMHLCGLESTPEIPTSLCPVHVEDERRAAAEDGLRRLAILEAHQRELDALGEERRELLTYRGELDVWAPRLEYLAASASRDHKRCILHANFSERLRDLGWEAVEADKSFQHHLRSITWNHGERVDWAERLASSRQARRRSNAELDIIEAELARLREVVALERDALKQDRLCYGVSLFGAEAWTVAWE